MLKKDKQKITEQKACNAFIKALDPELFDPDEKNGNYPGIDGRIQLMQGVGGNLIYSGKSFYYQIKGKESRKIDEKWNFHDFEAEYLDHYSRCDLPVVLVVVNVDSEEIFWEHLDSKLCEIKNNKEHKRIYANNEFSADDAYKKWSDLLNIQEDIKIAEETKKEKGIYTKYLKKFNLNIRNFNKNLLFYVSLLKVFKGDANLVAEYMKLNPLTHQTIKSFLIDAKIVKDEKGIIWFCEKDGVSMSEEFLNELINKGDINLIKLIRFRNE